MIVRPLLRAVVVTGVIALVLGGCGSAGQPPTLPSEDVCAVSSVIDGDTLNCVDGRRMRLLLIDAPELAQVPFGDQGRSVLLDLAPLGTELSVEYDVDPRDDFGRDLTYLWLPDGTMLNEAMAASGYAVALIIPPNGRYEERIRGAVAEASGAGRGLWADWKFACLPVDFRAGHCA